MSDYIVTKENRFKKDLFSSKLFIFFISLLCSLVIWSVVSMYKTPETERIFQDVKVQMALDDTIPGSMGMTVFGVNEFYCDVKTKGKSYLVNDDSFTSDKIIVKPELAEIREPGVYEVHLEAKLLNVSNELSVVSLDPEYITVYFDVAESKEFPITAEIAQDYEVAENCRIDSMQLNRETVTVIGPSLEMNVLKEVKAKVSFTDVISKSMQQTVIPEFLADGKTLEYVSVQPDADGVYLDIAVSANKTFELAIDFTGVPEGINLDELLEYSFTDIEDTVSLWIPTADEELMEASCISVGSLDFSGIQLQRNQICQIDRYSESIYNDILPESLRVRLTVQTDGWTSRMYTVPIRIDSAKYSNVSTPASIETVTVVMRETDAETFKSNEMYAVVFNDALARLNDGENTVNAEIILPKGCNTMWVIGKYPITVTKTAPAGSTTSADASTVK